MVQQLSPSQELGQMIIAVVMQIPYAKVASYGQIARMAGLPRHARLVGRILADLASDVDVPWHRVVNAQGKISLQKIDQLGVNVQAQKLMDEGVLVLNNKVNLKQYLWTPEL